MGGLGSGRWSRSQAKATVASRLALDLRSWQREGLLVAGNRFEVVRPQPGAWPIRLAVEVEAEAEQVVLTDGWSPPQSAAAAATWVSPSGPLRPGVIRLERQPAAIGGVRCWFRCPAPECARRVALLYRDGDRFVCRHCARLVYPSQRRSGFDRALARADALRQRLGADPTRIEARPPRPPGMHQATYQRVLDQIEAAEARAQWAMLARFAVG